MDDEREPPKVEDFGFHHPFSTVELAVSVLKRSNFVSWPEPGGYLDQSIEWVDDILTYLALERRARWEQEKGYVGYEDFENGNLNKLEDILG